MTQRELAAATGLNRVTIADIERGKADPRPSTVRTIARVLGVEPSDLMELAQD